MALESEASAPVQHKSSLCKFFREGRCQMGQACAFAHSEAELVARVWPKFERVSSSETRDAWAVRVLKAAAPFGTSDLSQIYRRAPGLFDVLRAAGGLKRFCEAHSDVLLLDSNLLRAPVLSFSCVAMLLRGEVQQRGGCVALAELYDKHSDLQQALREHGGVAEVCQRASKTQQMAVADGQVRVFEAVAEGAALYAFGSAVSGFGGPDSDVDVVLQAPATCLKRFSGVPGVLRELQKQFEKGGEFLVEEAVLGGRVPVLKLQLGELKCDVSCNNMLPLFNTALLAAYAALDARLVALVHAVKSWAKEQEIHSAVHGNLSSYAFTLLAIFYAQHIGVLPCLQSGLEPQWHVERGRAFNVAIRRVTDHELEVHRADTELDFQGFARFFSRDVYWCEQVVSVRTGTLLPLKECPQLGRNKFCVDEDLLQIEDPFDLSHNLNCVLWPEHSAKLRAALKKAAA